MVIIGKNERGSFDIMVQDVIYFESFGDDVYCVTSDKKLKVKSKLYELEGLYADREFIRVSKSFLINIIKVISITPQLNSKIKLKMVNNNSIYVNRTYLRAFKKYVMEGVE